jgi:hypothetical protein
MTSSVATFLTFNSKPSFFVPLRLGSIAAIRSEATCRRRSSDSR